MRPARGGSPIEIQHDVIVVGGGPAGYAAALYAAGIGLNVGLVEKGAMGGTCLHVGCIPAKELLETAHVFRTVSHAGDFGVSTSAPALDWDVTMQRKQSIIDQLVAGLGSMMKSRKVTVYNGIGTLGADRVVSVTQQGETQTLTAPTVILATGSLPRTIPGFEVDGKFVMTSDELLSIEALPQSAAVIGGGAIGCEFASMMADLGVDVTVIEALEQILTGCDRDRCQGCGAQLQEARYYGAYLGSGTWSFSRSFWFAHIGVLRRRPVCGRGPGGGVGWPSPQR